MRGIKKKGKSIQKAGILHCEYVVKKIQEKSKEEQRNIFYNVKELLKGKIEIDEEECWTYTWVNTFITADIELLRYMIAKNEEAMQCTVFRDMYESKFVREKKKEYSPVRMVNMMGIKVCPYCDRNYIDNVYREKDGKELRGNQLDHFFPKGKYPMLSMCFYNLIPVCASCNIHKLENEFSMSPYEDEIEEQSFFDIEVQGRLEEENIEVNLLYTPRIGENIEILALNEIYKGHKNIAYEIISKSVYYNREKKMELCRNYPGLFGTMEEIDRILYGMDFNNLNQRPLQKFYKDILKVYGSW